MGPATTASVLIVLLGLLGPSSQQGRVAPGVPPQQYGGGQHQQMGQMPPQHHQPPHHQQPPVQHHQQPPVQHHQQPPVQHHQQMQHQQVPQVPIQQIPVHQQVPVQQQHQYGQPQVPVHHAIPPQQILNAAHMAQEKDHHDGLFEYFPKDHIKEHLDVPIDTSNMSEQELQFHYFKMHDADNNNKLDGCELIKSLIHWHVEHKGTHENTMDNFTDQDLSSIMDQMLAKADKDNDGYLNYSEFIGSTGIKVDTH